MSQPEVWMRGAIVGIAPALQPVAHALLQAREDLDHLSEKLTDAELWLSPGGAACVGFHLHHLSGSLDRLFTYARGEELTEKQKTIVRAEREITQHPPALIALLEKFEATTESALEQLRNTPVATLTDARYVGRQRLPSTVLGLLFHAAEHTTRHVGQIITTLKIIRGLSLAG